MSENNGSNRVFFQKPSSSGKVKSTRFSGVEDEEKPKSKMRGEKRKIPLKKSKKKGEFSIHNGEKIQSKDVIESSQTPFVDNREKPHLKIDFLVKLKGRIWGVFSHFCTDLYKVKGDDFSPLFSALSRSFTVREIAEKDGFCTFQAPQKDRCEIIALINSLCYNHTIVGTKGFPRTIFSVLKRTGLVVGLFCAVCAFFVYPHFVFKVEMRGDCDKLVQDALISQGVKEGAFFLSFDGGKIEDSLLSLDGVSFASVEKVGTRVYVDVRLALPPDTQVAPAPLCVAQKDGVVTRVIVLSGTAEVAVGDSVAQGQTLIGGYYLKGEDKIPAPATGDVYGTRQVVVTRFFPDEAYLPSGRSKTKTALSLFGEVKEPKPPYQHYTVKHTVAKNDFLIPYVVHRWTYYEVCLAKNTMSEDEMKAYAYGKVIDSNQFEKVISRNATATRVDGGWMVTLTLTVEEKLN